jgi:hypothetical protein
MSYELKLTGFRTKQQVDEFLNWYGGQGEQDAAEWFDCRDGLGVRYMNVDYSQTPTWKDHTLTAVLNMIP